MQVFEIDRREWKDGGGDATTNAWTQKKNYREKGKYMFVYKSFPIYIHLNICEKTYEYFPISTAISWTSHL